MTPDCPPPDVLRKLAFGRVPPERERALDRHLSVCARCRQQHDDHFRPIVAAVRELSVNRSRGPAVTVVGGGPPPGLREVESTVSDLGSLGKFRLLEILGEGGMGRVYRARDTSLNREVALKVILLRGRSTATAEQRRGLFSEAQAAAKLNDDNIVQVYEVGEIDDTPYLVMPLLNGGTLAARLKRGPMALHELCRIGSRIARGLAAAHGANLVHRDIKPANVWLEPKPDGDAVRVLDFGLARPLTEVTEGLAGTPAYMAPEQAAGRAVDARADLFSLGVVLFEMTTGRRLFPGAAASMTELLASVKEFDAPSGAKLLPGAPPRLSALIAGLLRNDPQRRTPDDAEELADTLSALTAEFAPGRRRRKLFRIAQTAALVVASGMVVLGGVWAKRELLDAPTNLRRQWGPAERAQGEPKPVQAAPAPQAPQPPRPPAITAGEGLANLDHLDRARIPAAALKLAGEGDAGRVAAEVVAAFGRHSKPGADDGHDAGIETIALHPNGRLIATGGSDKAVRLWDLAQVPPKQTTALREHAAAVTKLAFTADGKRLVSGAADGRVVWWQLGSNAPPERREAQVHVTGLAVGQKRNLIAIGCGDGRVRVIDLDENRDTTVSGNRKAVSGLAFAENDSRLVMGSASSFLAVDLRAANKEVFNIPESKVWFTALAVSPDGSKLLTNGYGVLTGDLLKLFRGFGNNHDLELQRSLSVRSQSEKPVTENIMRHGERVLRAAFTPDGKRVVATTLDGNVHLWNWASGTRRAQIALSTDEGYRQSLFGLAVHPDGRHAIVSRGDGVVCVLRFSDK